MRGRFVRLGFWTAIVAFLVIEGDALLDQSEIGHATTLFMFGTACLAAAASITLFAIITAIGLAASVALKEEPNQQPPDRTQDALPVTPAHAGGPLNLPATSLASGRSRSRRYQQSAPTRRVTDGARKAPPQAL
jgi:hypothetical protein